MIGGILFHANRGGITKYDKFYKMILPKSLNSSNMPTEELIDILNKINYINIGQKSLPKGEFIYFSDRKGENNG